MSREILKSKEYFEKTIEIQADYVNAWNSLGIVYNELKEYQKAIEHYQRAIEVQTDFVHAWHGLRMAYFQKASPNYSLAQHCFNRFISLATHKEFAKYVFKITSFFKDYSDAPFMLKYLLEKIAINKNLLNYQNPQIPS